LNKQYVIQLARRALKEDAPEGDYTASFFKRRFKPIKAHFVAKETGVLCGIEIVAEIFRQSDAGVRCVPFAEDGQIVRKNQDVADVYGNAARILIAERVALNILMQLSGIATLTRKFVEKVKTTKAIIMDTRKTHPFLREVEKYAVKTGGARNHRLNLSEGILIKENYLKGSDLKNGQVINIPELEKIFYQMKKKREKIIIEVESLPEMTTIAPLRPEVIMLDNFTLSAIKKAVSYRNLYAPNIQLEVSGGVDLRNVHTIAATGVEYISIGSLTHSYPSMDFSLEIE